jgi:hypothetical protein
MKTRYLDITLMTPNQASKDVLFNSAITKIDVMSNCLVEDIKFSDIDTDRLKTKYKYLLLKPLDSEDSSEADNTIAYYSKISDNWEYAPIKNCFMVIVRKKFCIGFFSGKKWEFRKFSGENISINSIQ